MPKRTRPFEVSLYYICPSNILEDKDIRDVLKDFDRNDYKMFRSLKYGSTLLYDTKQSALKHYHDKARTWNVPVDLLEEPALFEVEFSKEFVADIYSFSLMYDSPDCLNEFKAQYVYPPNEVIGGKHNSITQLIADNCIGADGHRVFHGIEFPDTPNALSKNYVFVGEIVGVAEYRRLQYESFLT